METDIELSPNKEATLRKRRKGKWILLATVLFSPVLSAAGLWRDEQQYQGWHRLAVQYQRDCANPAAASQACQVVPLHVYEHTSKVSPDPDDSEADLWIGLQDKSGRTYHAQINNPQWDLLPVGAPVTATVWKGRVRSINGGGMTKDTQGNPVLRAEGAHSGVTVSWAFLAISIGTGALLLWGVHRMQRNQRTAELGNAGSR